MNRTRPGKRTALAVSSPEIERFKVRAALGAIYRYTFGIVADMDGMEGRSIGSGVGVFWNNGHLILTAAHTLKGTPVDRLYLMPPAETLEFADSLEETDRTKVKVRVRGQFETQRVVTSTDHDLATVVVPVQEEPIGHSHFYDLDSQRGIATIGKVVGISGYPSCHSQPLGKNYAVFPFCDLGRVCNGPVEYDSKTRLLVKYSAGADVDPYGLSGGGIWSFKKSGMVWSPRPALVGLMTDYYKSSGVLLGYRVATLLRFLRNNESQICSHEAGL